MKLIMYSTSMYRDQSGQRAGLQLNHQPVRTAQFPFNVESVFGRCALTIAKTMYILYSGQSVVVKLEKSTAY